MLVAKADASCEKPNLFSDPVNLDSIKREIVPGFTVIKEAAILLRPLLFIVSAKFLKVPPR